MSVLANAPVAAPSLDGVALFGFLAAFGAILCFIERRHARSFDLPLAICLAATAIYGFLQGAWPLGIVQIFWCGAAIGQWHRGRKLPRQSSAAGQTSNARLVRMFGNSDKTRIEEN